MLPKVHSVIAAIVVTTLMLVAGLGVTGAVRVAHNTANALEILHGGAAFDERLDWNQFSNPDSARRFQLITAKSDAAPPDAARPEEIAGIAPRLSADEAAAAIDAQVAAATGVDVPIDLADIPVATNESAKVPEATPRVANLAQPANPDVKPVPARKKRIVRRRKARVRGGARGATAAPARRGAGPQHVAATRLSLFPGTT
jgi:hypothetical protein